MARHNCASLLLANGVSMKEIQDWLGHSTFKTTADTYAHLAFDSKLSSANALSFGTAFGKMIPGQLPLATELNRIDVKQPSNACVVRVSAS